MSRRSGQSGTLVKAGGWWRVRVRLDVKGVEARAHRSLKVAPVSARLSRPELERRAMEVIAAAGVNSEDRFNQVVLGERSFKEQAKIYLREAVSRNRKPIRNTTYIEGALTKWIYPVLGDTPLSMIDNLSVKPLVEKLCKAGLSPRTVCKYVEFVKQIVRSLRNKNGEPTHKRVWCSDTMDLPLIVYKEQKRPALKAESISSLAASAIGQERILYIVLASSGLRISEALALESRDFINDGRTIRVSRQVSKDCPKISPCLKTEAATREVDLCKTVADFLRPYVTSKNGLIFRTSRGTPHLYHNLETRWLNPRLAKLGIDEEGMGWHSFRRYRNSWARKQRIQEDYRLFWMGHKPEKMGEVYTDISDDLPGRIAEADRVGHGFNLPTKLEVVPLVPRLRLVPLAISAASTV
jgi:integrase